MTTQERYDEWLRRSSEIARELKLEIVFTTQACGTGFGFESYDVPVVEISETDTHGYLEVEGSVYIP